MKFDVHGPFEIPYTTKNRVKRVHKEGLNTFWREEALVDLRAARGCYIFATRAKGNAFTPWYVGKAENTPFGTETLNSSNRDKYNEVLHSHVERADPVVFFLPQLTGKNSIGTAGKAKRPAIIWLEQILIAHAYNANRKLVNVSGTKKHRIEIIGVMNSDLRMSKTGPRKDLRDMLKMP